MHKLMEYICDELEEIERKADKEGKLSMTEVQYMDTLLHAKKNLLKSEEMYEESEYSEAGGSYARGGRSNAGGSYAGGSYARGGRGRSNSSRGNSMNGYSARGGSYEGGSYRGSSYDGYSREDAKEELMMSLQELERDASDEESRRIIKKWIKQLEQG